MRKITALVDHELTWTQSGAFKQEYELRFGDELVARLRFPKMLSSVAVAESGDGAWTFKRVGFWKARTLIRMAGSDSDLGVYTQNTWRGGGVLQMPDGRKYVVAVGLWRRTLEFQTEVGETLVHIKNRGAFRLSASVQMYRKALRVPELAWLVLLGLYLIVMMRRDAAKHAAAG